jgi:LysM repeat protein
MKNFLATLAAMTLLCACSSMPQMPKMPSFSMPGFGAATPPAVSTAEKPELAPALVAPAPEASAREQVAYAIELLDGGRSAEAKTALQAALSKSPKDPTAPQLLKQIDADPVILLGDKSEPYIVAAGDTMSALAERYLDDPLLFYALARYNGLAAPNTLSVGRMLKIPVRPGKSITTAGVKPASGVSAASAANAGKANTVRLQALELLNSGEVARAVSLLTEAQTLDGTNVAIRKDLERARRIQSALADG